MLAEETSQDEQIGTPGMMDVPFRVNNNGGGGDTSLA